MAAGTTTAHGAHGADRAHGASGADARTEVRDGIMPTSLFTEAARVLAKHVAGMDLTVPGFRSPPRTVGVNRTLRRASDGLGGIVAVRLTDRPFTAVIGDMIEGVVVLNRLDVADADRARTHLWRLMLAFTVEAVPARRRDAPNRRVA
ncbi:MAG: hypothetical protein ACKOCC_04325 [Actinomycetota bacterium]